MKAVVLHVQNWNPTASFPRAWVFYLFVFQSLLNLNVSHVVCSLKSLVIIHQIQHVFKSFPSKTPAGMSWRCAQHGVFPSVFYHHFYLNSCHQVDTPGCVHVFLLGKNCCACIRRMCQLHVFYLKDNYVCVTGFRLCDKDCHLLYSSEIWINIPHMNDTLYSYTCLCVSETI